MTHCTPLPARTLIVSSALPPEAIGQAIVMNRWLRDTDPTSYVLLSFMPQVSSFRSDSMHRALDAKTYRFPTRQRSWRRKSIRAIPQALSDVARMVRTLVEVIRKEHIEVVVACSGSPSDLPVSVIAAAIARVPVIISLFDRWRYQWPYKQYRFIAGLVEPFLLRSAAVIIAPNEALAGSIQRAVGRKPAIVRNPYEPALTIEAPGVRPWPTVPGRVRMLYAGSFYVAQYDAVENVAAALHSPRLSNVSLDIHISFENVIEDNGQFGPNVRLQPFAAPPDIYERERDADILLLPLGFKTPYPEVIRTASPTKVAEYLASGRPILVHAPADSWVASYFRTHQCGIVVSEPDPERIVDAILTIIHDDARRNGMVERARARVDDFSPEVAREAFFASIRDAAGRRR